MWKSFRNPFLLLLRHSHDWLNMIFEKTLKFHDKIKFKYERKLFTNFSSSSSHFQVKIWFQNRRTKWKKQENVVNPDEHKTNGITTSSKVVTSQQDFRSDSTSPIGGSKTTKSVAAELSAKIAAKQNSRLKQHPNNGGQKISSKHMEPPKMKIHSHSQKTSLSPNLHHHDLPLQFMEKKPSYHNFHDVESRLNSTKISINDFKHAKGVATPVALNLNKRNYLWKKSKFQKSKGKERQSNDEKWHDEFLKQNEVFAVKWVSFKLLDKQQAQHTTWKHIKRIS